MAMIGSVSLLGLASYSPRLASLGSPLTPMAPSTALLLIIQGVICLLAARRQEKKNQRTVWGPIILSGCCTAIAGALFVLFLNGIVTDAEYLGIQLLENGKNPMLHHMSPFTALAFVMAGIFIPSHFTTTPEKRFRALVSFWIALLLMASFAMLLMAYLFGAPRLYSGTMNLPAATTAIAFILFSLAMALLSIRVVQPDIVRVGRETRHLSLALVLVFVLLVASIVSAGYFYHKRNEKLHLEAVRNQLSAIADLKLGEITLWRKERLIDAGFYYNNRSFARVVESFLQTAASRRQKHELRNWLAFLEAHENYDGIYLFDLRGRDLLNPHGDPEAYPPYVAKQTAEALSSGKVVFTDFYQIKRNGKPHLSILIPIYASSGSGEQRAVLALRINPERYLYPFIKRWPTLSATAETLIVRRDGNDILFLNEVRFRPRSAMELRLPLTQVQTPAVMAVLGQTGIVEGLDYRGVPVYAALRAIPDSPWFLVARMDTSEIFRPLREKFWVTITLAAVLLFGAAMTIAFVWRQRDALYYRQSEQQARRVRERLQSIVNVMQYPAQTVQGLLDYALAEAVRLTSSEYGCIFLYDESRQRFTLCSKTRAMAPAGGTASVQTGFDLEKSDIWGEAIRQRKPVIMNNIAPDLPPGTDAMGGNGRPFRFLAIPVIDQGRTTAVVGVANKMTDYKETNALQLSLLMDAVWKTAERKRYEEELRQRNDEMERFTYAVSHDLKSPLVTITAFLGFLESDLKNDNQARIPKDVAYIRTAAEKMGNLLSELLELSRIGRVISKPSRVRFQDVVREALRLVAGSISERGVAVTVRENRIMLFGDRPRLVEICQNLVENAVKYMGNQPEPRIEIGVETEGEETVFFVRDNGMGIDMRYQDNIFGLFNKLDADSDGSGLGLALVKRIVEIHGGRIWVTSDGPGRGSCFRFTLPKALETAEEEKNNGSIMETGISGKETVDERRAANHTDC